MTKDEFISNVENGRRQWQQRWKGIDLFGTSRPRTPGDMSLRDILYHVAWYEREMIELLQLRSLVGSPWWKLPVNERNEYIKTEGQTVSLLQAWRLEQQLYTELLVQLDTLTDDDLNNASRFKDMPDDWIPWEVIASNTYEHYAEHFTDIF